MSNHIQIEVRDSLLDVGAAQWNALNDDGNPFLRYEFLHNLQSMGCLGEKTGWYPRYFLLWQGEEPEQQLVGAAATYIKTNSYGEFVFDWSWAEAYERNQMDYYPKLVCSIPFTPATGRRLLTRADQPFGYTVRLLAAGIRQFVLTEELSGGHILFLTEAESEALSGADAQIDEERASLSQKQTKADEDYDDQSQESAKRRGTDYLRRMDCQYHWHNDNYTDFDDFLARCTSKRRKTIRRERRHVSDANLRLEQRKGSTLSEEEWQWVHQFYTSTFDRKWGNPSLTRRFFEKIGQQMGEQILIVFAYAPDDKMPEWPVACSIMFIGTSTLYGRFWGCRTEFNALHFEACYYQGIEYCIENGIQNFEPGAQGEHKITRGFVPTLTRSAHFISHPQFRDAIENFLSHETPHVQQRCKGLSDLLPFKQPSLSV